MSVRPRLRQLPGGTLLGRPASLREKEREGIGRYFGLCTDHKVVGIQYLVGIGVFFFIGRPERDADRLELIHEVPRSSARPVPLDRRHTRLDDDGDDDLGDPGAVRELLRADHDRRAADGVPPHRALTFWLLMAAGFILMSTIFFGGFPTGWTGYEPLNDQAVMGMDSYIMFFALVGISMTLLGLNDACPPRTGASRG